jgi:hypothetical protein
MDEHVELAGFNEVGRLLRADVVDVQDGLFGDVGAPAGRQIIKDMDFVSVIEERVCNVGPDEAGTAGDKSFHESQLLTPVENVRQRRRPEG